jgi:hypothetical protein
MNRPEVTKGYHHCSVKLISLVSNASKRDFTVVGWAMIEKISSVCVISDYSSTSWLLDQGTWE